MNSADSSFKRRRDGTPVAAVRNTGATSKRGQLFTQVQFATEYLKSKKGERSFNDITSYLSIQNANDPTALKTFRLLLQRSIARVQYNAHGLNGQGSYKYKPVIPVESGQDLKRYLQQRTDSVALKFDDIKDGWLEAQSGVDAMAARGELLVLRDKKGQAKAVWQDDPSMRRAISDDLKHAWHDIKLPANPDDLRDKLEAVGLKPTSAPRQIVKRVQHKDNKKRGPRKGGRTTNTHISHLLRDYSDQRK